MISLQIRSRSAAFSRMRASADSIFSMPLKEISRGTFICTSSSNQPHWRAGRSRAPRSRAFREPQGPEGNRESRPPCGRHGLLRGIAATAAERGRPYESRLASRAGYVQRRRLRRVPRLPLSSLQKNLYPPCSMQFSFASSLLVLEQTRNKGYPVLCRNKRLTP